jgi:cytochrome c biogenesis protein CcdA
MFPKLTKPNGQLIRALIAIVFALAIPLTGAILVNSPLNRLTHSIEVLSGSVANLLVDFSGLLPFGYAYAAGMVSSANPCGFALLPAYLGLYVGDFNGPNQANWVLLKLARALMVTLVVTMGFILLFGVTGLMIGAGITFVVRLFPWIGLSIGVLLVLVGAWLLFGGKLYLSTLNKIAEHTGNINQINIKGYFAFGLAYGTASIGCTLPIFLAVIGTSLTKETTLGTAIQLIAYGLGMGTMIFGLTLSIALFQGALVRALKKTAPYIQKAGAVFLILAGSYLVYYWLTLGELLN